MDRFRDIGFLSEELDTWAQSIRKEFSAEVEIAERINRLAIRIMMSLPTESIHDEKLLGAAAFGRATQSFQISYQLALRGAMCESRAIARLCTEAVIAMGALEKVPGTLKVFQDDYDCHRKTLSNSVLAGHRFDKSDELSAKRLKAVVADIETTHGTATIKRINWASLADSAGLKELYDIGYRMPSGDAAHIGLGSLNRHVLGDDQNEMIGFKFRPEKNDFKATIFTAIGSMAYLFQIALRWFEVHQFSDEIHTCVSDWNAVF